ncbi:MAG: dienelactone hydrolase family protein [Sulfuritalea sp.]|nr:dienelactone hydrolase family protein [Sulfuritalea sp.]
MLIKDSEIVDLNTPTGEMRAHIFRPAAPGNYPGILMFSEIFQVTAPIRRTAAMLAGHGFIVACPEIYHELEPAGTVIPYDEEGTTRGNAHKITKEIHAYDSDARAVLDYLKSRSDCTGRLGVMGICVGGHLAFRAAMNPGVLAAVCFYATDIHKKALGLGKNDNSLERAGEIKGELLHIWGRQDPHVPLEGRNMVKARLDEVGTRYTWHEFNGQHAFMRDEGHRYDPALSRLSWDLLLELFHRRLGWGDLDMETDGAPAESRH